MAFVLYTDHPLGKRIVTLLTHEIDVAHKALSHRSIDDEMVHDARRCGKRSRALLRLVRPLLSDGMYRREKRCWRSLGRRLSPGREAAALGMTIDRLRARYPEQISAKDAATLGQQTVPIHAAALRALRRDLAPLSEKLISARRRISRWRLSAHWDGVWRGLSRCHRRARRAYRAAMRHCDHDHRHEWRKRLKDLLYQAHLLRQLWPRLSKAWERKLEKLGDMLGDEHDLHLLRQHLRSLPTNRSIAERADRLAGRWIHWIRQRTKGLGKRIHAESTKMLIARLRACRTVER